MKVLDVQEPSDGSLLIQVEMDNEEERDAYIRRGLTKLLDGEARVVIPPSERSSTCKTIELDEDVARELIGLVIVDDLVSKSKEIILAAGNGI